MKIIFLDIDGVLNCQLFFDKKIANGIKQHFSKDICPDRVSWLNELCKDTGAKVVISSTWRHSGLSYCQEVLKESGAIFDIIDITPDLRGDHCLRGNEILKWIKDNEALLGCNYFDFHTYVIIDDESDMLYWQRNNFFQTDTYSGLTPNICYKIKRFFNKFN